jgi:hypothetical protein
LRKHTKDEEEKEADGRAVKVGDGVRDEEQTHHDALLHL